ncbi:MAG TPA: hypothetical protein VFV71_00870 [Burkholderiales bacterium]|nr:hypothetical protein [Burkholderiales bacterium]
MDDLKKLPHRAPAAMPGSRFSREPHLVHHPPHVLQPVDRSARPALQPLRRLRHHRPVAAGKQPAGHGHQLGCAQNPDIDRNGGKFNAVRFLVGTSANFRNPGQDPDARAQRKARRGSEGHAATENLPIPIRMAKETPRISFCFPLRSLRPLRLCSGM